MSKATESETIRAADDAAWDEQRRALDRGQAEAREQMARNAADDYLFRRKMASYCEKPVTRLVQVDMFTGHEYDTVVRGDENGDGVTFSVTHELMSTPSADHLPVRVLIHPDTDPEVARRLLTKASGCVELALECAADTTPAAAATFPF